MQVTTKLFAQYQDHCYGNKTPVEVASEHDGVLRAVNATRFKTFERTFIEFEGEQFEGKPKNHSGWIYVGVENIYTLDQVIASFEAQVEAANKKSDFRNSFEKSIDVGAIKSVIQHYKNKDPATVFISESGRVGDFIEIKPTDKVYNSNAQKIWPQENAPVPVVDITPEA